MQVFDHQPAAGRPVAQALPGQDLAVAVVCARFNAQACEELLVACLAELAELGVPQAGTTVVRVPGALEIPLALQVLAQTRRPDAMIALGAVIRGETYHFELVSNEMGAGITQVQLDTGIPIANGVLTTEDDAQTHARTRGKGRDCAQAAVEMARLLAALRAPA
ncbi:MAG: 6,7-dimethyl-8-ribityllumazine synthase [Pseudomonadota bacterium]|nr:6,7-dimethyl-8-ribityllumazine synthase [Pseudomonadota bacterium]